LRPDVDVVVVVVVDVDRDGEVDERAAARQRTS